MLISITIGNTRAVRIPKWNTKSTVSKNLNEKLTTISNHIQQVLIELMEEYDKHYNYTCKSITTSKKEKKDEDNDIYNLKQNLLKLIKVIIQTRKVNEVVNYFKRTKLSDELQRRIWDSLVDITSPITNTETEYIVLKTLSDFSQNVSSTNYV